MPAKTSTVPTRRRTRKSTAAKVSTTRTDSRPDVKLLTIQDYWNDIRNRSQIHNYEFNEAVKDMKKVIEFASPYHDKMVKKVRSLATN